MKVSLPFFPTIPSTFKSFLLLTLMVFSATAAMAQAQNPFWVFANNSLTSGPNPTITSTVGSFDFSGNSPQYTDRPVPLNLNQTGAYNGIWDECGDLQLLVVHGEIYDENLNLITAMQDYIPEENFEIAISPIPNFQGEYVIVYTRSLTLSTGDVVVTPAYYTYDVVSKNLSAAQYIFAEETGVNGEELTCTYFFSLRYAISPEFNQSNLRTLYILAQTAFSDAYELYETQIISSGSGIQEIDCNTATPLHVLPISQSGWAGPVSESVEHERISLELELSPDGKFLCWGEMGVLPGDWGAFHLVDATSMSYLNSLQVIAGWENIAGIEFDATSTWLAASGNIVPQLTGKENIMAFPVNNILNQSYGGFTPLADTERDSTGMIELAYNGKMYSSTSRRLYGFTVDPTSSNPVTHNPADNIFIDSYGGVPRFFTDSYAPGGILIDQIDGDQYYIASNCEGNTGSDGPIWDDRKENVDPGSQPYPNPLPIGEYLHLPSLSDVLPQVYELSTSLPVAIDAQFYGDHWQIELIDPQPGAYALVQESDVWLFEAF